MNLDELVALAETRDEWPVVAEHHCPRCRGGNHRLVARTVLVDGHHLFVSLPLNDEQMKSWVKPWAEVREAAQETHLLRVVPGGRLPPIQRLYYATPDGTAHPAYCDRCGPCTVIA